MRNKIFVLVAVAFLSFLSSCTKICTDEFRMITLKLNSSTESVITLDEAYTIRKSTGQKITYSQPMSENIFVVLDDSYHSSLKNSSDDFQFIGKKNNQTVVDEIFKISADRCHIQKVSGKDSVTVN